jgi:hypothetical protein
VEHSSTHYADSLALTRAREKAASQTQVQSDFRRLFRVLPSDSKEEAWLLSARTSGGETEWGQLQPLAAEKAIFRLRHYAYNAGIRSE